MAGYCNVQQRFEGSTPDGSPTTGEVSGKVEFTPYIQYGDAWRVNDGASYYMVPATSVKADIVNGVLQYEGSPGVSLFAGGAGSNPENVQWVATYRDITVEGEPAFLKEFVFDVAPDTTVDLSLATPVVGMDPIGYIQGDRGVQGIRGIQGEQGSIWHSGTDAPDMVPGQRTGDWYVNTDTGDAYERTSSSWVLRLNIKGPQGDGMWVGTIIEYNALTSPDPTRLHVIVNS